MSISAMKQAFSALREMRHALSRAHDTMRRPTKYVSDAMTKSESAIKALQQAIAEAEKQEPVAWEYTTSYVPNPDRDNGIRVTNDLRVAEVNALPGSIKPLGYTAPVHAIAEAEKLMPVAWNGECVLGHCGSPSGCEDSGYCRAAPPKREWVGLTDEEAKKTFEEHNCVISADLAGILARAIEAKLKEKNT